MNGLPGRYRPESHFEALRDEIVMELIEGLRGPREQRERAFREALRLGWRYIALLQRQPVEHA